MTGETNYIEDSMPLVEIHPMPPGDAAVGRILDAYRDDHVTKREAECEIAMLMKLGELEMLRGWVGRDGEDGESGVEISVRRLERLSELEREGIDVLKRWVAAKPYQGVSGLYLAYEERLEEIGARIAGLEAGNDD